MLYNGKYYITVETIAKHLNMNDDCAFYSERYREMFKDVDRVKKWNVMWYEQSGVMGVLETLRMKELFLVEVQKCLMLIVDESGDYKAQIARNVGLKSNGALDSFLANTTYTKTVAKVLVGMWRNYKQFVKRYDKGDY